MADVPLNAPRVRLSVATPTVFDPTTFKTLLLKGYNVNTTGNYADIGVVLQGGTGSLFPAAAALSAGFTTPTTTQIGAFEMGFNGATWDPVRTGVFTASTAPTGALLSNLMAVNNTTKPTYTDGQYGHLQMGTRGALGVQIMDTNGASGSRVSTPDSNIAAGSNPTLIVLPSGQYNATPPTMSDTRISSLQLGVSGGLLAHSPQMTLYNSWSTITKANIKASAGYVFSLYAINRNAAVRYIQLHNKATAPAGTDVPLQSFPVPAGTTNNPGVLVLDDTFFDSARYSTGIGWAISTTEATFTDSATASDTSVEIHYL